jgi:formate hydrogenlyase subunit 3/multisubunit Na+/H+ antiporter MnhD subunit
MFTIAAIGMVGMPPLVSFGAKWFIAAGVYTAPGVADWAQAALLLSLVASSVLNAAYFFPIVFRAYFGKSEENVKEAPWKITLPLTVTALGAIVIGMFPDVPLAKIKSIGNGAGFGARLALLSKSKGAEADEIARRIHYVELSAEGDFQREFLKALDLPHADGILFPTATRIIESGGRDLPKGALGSGGAKR